MSGRWMDDSEVLHKQHSSWLFRTLDDGFQSITDFFVNYGWRCLGGLIVSLFLWNWLQPKLEAWRRAREDAAYHKDPDRVLAREEAVLKARLAQEARLRAESERRAEMQREREEKKKRETAELLEKSDYIPGVSGRTKPINGGYLPLSGGGGTSTYRPKKRSACSGGGCG